jgi:hypothetical protein
MDAILAILVLGTAIFFGDSSLAPVMSAPKKSSGWVSGTSGILSHQNLRLKHETARAECERR